MDPLDDQIDRETHHHYHTDGDRGARGRAFDETANPSSNLGKRRSRKEMSADDFRHDALPPLSDPWTRNSRRTHVSAALGIAALAGDRTTRRPTSGRCHRWLEMDLHFGTTGALEIYLGADRVRQRLFVVRTYVIGRTLGVE